MTIFRRGLLIAIGSGFAFFTCLRFARAVCPNQADHAVSMIHVTDLFRPHNDPDDHWDLACVYALAYRGQVDLRGVLIDHPKSERHNDPDVFAVAQMNYLTGVAVPVAVGSPRPFSEAPAESDLLGVRSMLKWMKESPQPVVLNILGSCRDVALAARLEPELFASKCRAIYLNAGSGTRDPAEATHREWNVRLDPASYAALFDLPCPIYWMPCFHAVQPEAAKLFRVGEYGSFYRFHQGDILPEMSDRMQRYFAFMFQQGHLVPQSLRTSFGSTEWLRAFDIVPRPELMDAINAMDRNMWCTGGFLHAVGQTVTPDGRIISLDDARNPVFTFDPVQVSCSADAITHWEPESNSAHHFIFHVRDTKRYSSAMTSALKNLLKQLP